jgi:glycosyltransferase involved in cell wall biosynthesis
MGTATTFLALALARMGHSVEILLGVMHRPESIDPYWHDIYRRAGIQIRGAPASDEPVEPWPFLRARSIELGLRENPPDVVVAHDLAAPAYTALRMRQAGLAFEDTVFVVFCHGSRRYALDLSPNLAPKDLRHVLALGIHEQASVELADVVVSPSAYLLDWMRDAGWRLPERTLVIPYFARSDVIDEPPTAVPDEDGTRLERLAFFGRLDERKGVKVFAAGLNALEPDLLARLEVEFVGRTTATWTRERVEALFSDATKRGLRRLAFETQLDQHEALAHLRRPGTLVVMPSLGENSPNTVYECLEHGIPFIASNVGGIPELIAAEDRARVLFEPTPRGLAAALRRMLEDWYVLRPPRAAFDAAGSYRRWAEVIDIGPPQRTVSADAPADVVVIPRLERASAEADRQAGLRRGTAPFVVLLDEDDVPTRGLVETLVRAQGASGADVVTCGVRLVDADGERALHLFSGDPGGLGVLGNGYGTAALFRREALADATTAWPAESDAAWPLLARLTASGARVVSIPAPLVTRTAGVGSVEDDPGDALLAVHELERALPDSLRGTARLTAGLAANAPRAAAARRRDRGGASWILRLTAAAVRRLSGSRG